MATSQEQYRLETAYDNLRRAASQSEQYKQAIQQAVQTHLRLSNVINNVLTDSNLGDSDYITNGGRSPTIGEYKSALRAACSFLSHAGEMSDSEAKDIMNDAGISDNTIADTPKLDGLFDKLRL